MKKVQSFAAVMLVLTGAALVSSAAEARKSDDGAACRISFSNGGYLQGRVVDGGANCNGTAYDKAGHSLGAGVTKIPVLNN